MAVDSVRRPSTAIFHNSSRLPLPLGPSADLPEVRYLYRLGACFVVCVRVSVVSVCCLREGFRMADDAVQGAGRNVMDEDAAQPLSGVAAVDSQESRNYTRTGSQRPTSYTQPHATRHATRDTGHIYRTTIIRFCAESPSRFIKIIQMLIGTRTHCLD